MRLSLHTDYALRVLILLACNPDSRVLIRNISELYVIFHNHLVKVLRHLCLSGIVQGTRGRIIGLMETGREFLGTCSPSDSTGC